MAKLSIISINSPANSSLAHLSHRRPTWAFAAMWYNSANNAGSDYYIGTEPPKDFISSRYKRKVGKIGPMLKNRKIESDFWYYPTMYRSYYGKRFSSREQAEEWLAHQKKVSRASWAAFLAD